MSLDDSVHQIIEDTGSINAAKEVLFAEASAIEEAAAQYSVEADYLIESALQIACRYLYGDDDLVKRVQNYWLQCHTLAGATPYEIVVRSAEFLAAALQIHPLPEGKLRELAESSDWQDRLVAGWVVRDRGDTASKDIAKILATDTFTDDNGFFLIREAVGEYE